MGHSRLCPSQVPQLRRAGGHFRPSASLARSLTLARPEASGPACPLPAIRERAGCWPANPAASDIRREACKQRQGSRPAARACCNVAHCFHSAGRRGRAEARCALGLALSCVRVGGCKPGGPIGRVDGRLHHRAGSFSQGTLHLLARCAPPATFCPAANMSCFSSSASSLFRFSVAADSPSMAAERAVGMESADAWGERRRSRRRQWRRRLRHRQAAHPKLLRRALSPFQGSAAGREVSVRGLPVVS